MVQKTLRSLGMLIDTGVYKLVEWLLQSIIDLSSVEIFSTSIIEEFSTRIYMILGLIMVFKLMISFFQMLINPEKMDDKEQGAANILKRVVISLALIFLVPSIFDLARTLQTEVLPIIPKVVLGVDLDGVTDEESSAAYSSVGQLMAFYSFSPFFTYQNDTCNDGSILGSSDDETNLTIYSVNTARIHINDTDVCSTEDNFKYSYTPLISTVVGAYLVYVLVSVAVAVAVRAVKLSVCELIAPIPIASYIDPKKSKETFDKWVSISIKTYLDLFIRLIIVYFVIYMFQVLFGSDSNFIQQVLVNVCGGNLFRKSIVVCFVIVGLLQFIKEAPKFLTDMLGLSSAGNFAGMFKGEGFKAIGSTYAAPAGALVAGAGNAYNAIREKRGFTGTVKSFGAGLASGAWNGSKALLKGKSGKEIWNSSTQIPWNRRNLRTADRAAGVTFSDRMKAGIMDWLKLNDEVSLSEGIQKGISTIRGDISNSKKATFGRIDKTGDISFHGLHDEGKSSTIQQLGELMYENYDSLTWNSELKSMFSKFGYTTDSSGTRHWKIRAGEKFSYHDLNAIRTNAVTSGVGSLAAALEDNGYLKLGAQKEIHENTTKGVATKSDGSIYTKFMEHPDINYAKKSAYQDIAKVAADIGEVEFEYTDSSGIKQKVKASTVDEMKNAYTEHQSEFDDALSRKIAEVSANVSSSKTATARSSNQRWKNSGKQ